MNYIGCIVSIMLISELVEGLHRVKAFFEVIEPGNIPDLGTYRDVKSSRALNGPLMMRP